MITHDNFTHFYEATGEDYALRVDNVRALMP